MDTLRRAPGLGELARDVRAPAPPSGQPSEPHRAPSVAEREELVRHVAEALRENLARGYLESEEYLRRIAETLDQIVFLTDASLTAIPFVNAAYERIWGRPREELYRDPMAFMQGVHPDDRERLREALLARPGSPYDIEFRVVRPDGETRWVWTRGFPVPAADGTVAWIAGIAEDTTDRKRVTESHAQLVRGFTHDVKNPLGAADGYLALLQEGVYGELSREQVGAIDHARRSIRSALDLVVQMLDLERAQTGNIDLHRESFDLGAAVRQVLDEYRPAATARRMALGLLLPDDPEALVVYSDSLRVKQIIGNLVSNAVKYTQATGRCDVAVRVVESRDAPLTGPWVAVTVADNGPGIPLAKQHLLFREFSRFDPDSAEGSGIGLAISQQVARALEGKITFESAPGAGSAFTFWLPKDRRARPA